MAIEKIIRPGGLERNCQSLAFDRPINDSGRLQILSEQVLPFLHFFRVHQQQRASYIADAREILSGALSYINHPHMMMESQRGSPGNRNSAHPELRDRLRSILSRDGYVRGRFRP